MTDWYTKSIEEPVRDLVKYLRNNGINTECSCGHDMYIQCQYRPDGFIYDLHCLLFEYFSGKEGSDNFSDINYNIVVNHKVIRGNFHSSIDIELTDKYGNKLNNNKGDSHEN